MFDKAFLFQSDTGVPIKRFSGFVSRFLVFYYFIRLFREHIKGIQRNSLMINDGCLLKLAKVCTRSFLGYLLSILSTATRKSRNTKQIDTNILKTIFNQFVLSKYSEFLIFHVDKLCQTVFILCVFHFKKDNLLRTKQTLNITRFWLIRLRVNVPCKQEKKDFYKKYHTKTFCYYKYMKMYFVNFLFSCI